MNLKSLNAVQKEAVEYYNGSSIIVAGAGSGKTRVLTYKIAYQISKGIKPENILALTFTNKASNEMKDRIKELIGAKANFLWMGTFHSIFAKILRTEAEHINYGKNFAIYDTEDSISLVQNTLTNLNIEINDATAKSIRHKIGVMKNHMISPEEFREKHAKSTTDKKIATVFEEYQKRLVINNAMDFEDLLLKPIELFQSNNKILQKYKKIFKYVLVDEFQDTNIAQYTLLKMLVNKTGNICVVGDDAQSIYSWRGATISNMLNFEKHFTKCKTFKLEQNYRSTKCILMAADSVIKNNKNQIQKTLWTENNDGEQLILLKCSDEKDEAFQIAKFIQKEIIKKKLSHKDFAILYRTNAQSRALEDIFRREKIPYKIVGGIEFYRRKEIKDLIAYLKVLSNQYDEESLLRIMNYPQRGIGSTTLKRMIGFARKHDLTMFKTMARIFEVIDIKERIQKNVKGFRLLLDKYIDLKDKLSIGELSRALVDELGILRALKSQNTTDSLSRRENINEFLSALTEFSDNNKKATLEDFLEEVSLISGIDTYENEKNSVTFMTIHSAKGLEFPIVFISGCEEDIFPLANRFNSDASIEEERRLFYVAITRAKQKVFISHARSRYRFGEVAYQSRSRFIEEINKDTLNELNGGIGRRSPRKTKKQVYYEYFEKMDYDDFNQDNANLVPGSRVMHEKFGLGKVTDVVGAGDMQKATVQFEGNNIKQLMLKFARLKIL
ncbi:MAG: UvrD-helicase domain-containing protein [Bacteroidetes bacterium]|nr:UvrD-helicase domain-containing protein [Bacteroidota bacterium]